MQAQLSSPKPRLALLAAVLLAASLAAAAVPRAAAAQTCDRSGCGFLTGQCGGTPVHPVPQALWGNLQPADNTPCPGNPSAVCIPAGRDATYFSDVDPSSGSYFTAPIFADIAATNTGYLYVAQAQRFQVWDPHANPGNPTQIGNIEGGSTTDGSGGTFPFWATGENDKTPLNTVAVPADTDTLVALGGDFNIGLGILSVTGDRSKPALLYQGYGPSTTSLYAATIGGTHYAFLGSDGPVRVFNMDRAAQLAAPPCGEDLRTQAGQQCPGVYVGTVGSSPLPFPWVHGTGNLLATATGNAFPGGVQIWDVSNPASPQLKTTVLTQTAVYGVAMWQSGGHSWLAARTVNATNVAGLSTFDVTCAASGGCSQPPAPAFNGVFNEPLLQRLFLTFTRDGSGRPYIYTGSDSQCGAPTTQREWLFDMSNPASPVDITPAPQVYNGNLTGYWGWYYRANPTGFNRIDPRHGAFIGNYFYRAAWFLFDVHKLTTNTPPVASFSVSPGQIYPGTPVTFTDTSTGNPQHSTDWTFSPDGSPATAHNAASVPVTFAAKGTKTVTLVDNQGVPSATTSTQNVTVLVDLL